MRTIGAYELKTHLSEVLDAVEHGQAIVVTRHGKAIARILPDGAAAQEDVGKTVQALIDFPRTALPAGMTVRDLIDEGRK